MWFSKKRIYADTAAATPIDEHVLRVLEIESRRVFGNSASIHAEGVLAEQKLEAARRLIANNLDAEPDEIIITSGGTEGNLLAIRGVYEAFKNETKREGEIIVLSTEHQSVLEAARSCESLGAKVIYLPVTNSGEVDLSELKKALTKDTVLVSISYANNEIGTIAPLSEIGRLIRSFKKENHLSVYPYFHTDACQAPRFLPLTVPSLGVDLMTINSSKMYGPKGIGFLYRKRGVKLTPLIVGGGQEWGLRSGSQNVPAVCAMAAALQLCTQKRDKEGKRLSLYRGMILKELIKLPGAIVYGSENNRLPHNLTIGFPNVDAEQLVIALDARGISVSTGSACSSRAKPESHVLKALEAKTSAIRLTLGRDTTKHDTRRITSAIQKEVLSIQRVATFLH